MKTLTLIIGLLMTVTLQAQDVTVKAELFKDTVGYEESVQVTFTIENEMNARFNPPAFEGFASAKSNGSSMQTSIVNGKSSSSKSFTYILTHRGSNIYEIEAASFEVGSKIYTTKPLIVVVSDEATTPNPPSLEEQFGFGSDYGFFRRPSYRFPTLPEKKPDAPKENPSKTDKRTKVYKM
jgi:hypothetical protein